MPDELGIRMRTRRGRWVLAATVLGSAMAMLDATVVGIAQPTIGREFHADVAGLQWVSIGYLLTLSGLLLLAGALGDRYGRRRVFLIGVAWFAAASALCAVAPNIAFLIVARTLQGVGGALLTPGSLAIIEASFAPADRGRAIGAWSGLGGIAAAIGPFLGGWLIAAVSWRLIFVINVPVAIAVILVSLRHVPESADPDAKGRIDLLGSALVIAALVGISYGLVEGPDLGWTSSAVLGTLLAGLVALVLFIIVERRSRDPVVPFSIFRSLQFSGTNLVTLFVYAVMGGMFFLLPIELQQVSHYSPTAAGASLLPVTFLMLALSARSGQLASRIGPRLQMSVGPIVVAVGLALYARIDASGGYLAEVLPAVLAFGFGLVITVAPLTATALSSAPASRTGLASAVNNTVARAGSLLAVAVLPPLAGITGSSYLHPAQFETGFQSAAFISAAVCAFGGLVAFATIRNPRRATPEPTTHEGGEYSCAVGAPPFRTHEAAAPPEPVPAAEA
jgi:EmrB/QacA subfamily drug resistance transporter